MDQDTSVPDGSADAGLFLQCYTPRVNEMDTAGNKYRDNDGLLVAARQLVALDYRVTPLRGKRPLLPNWPERRDECLDDSTLETWFARFRYNIGILTGSVIVADMDTKESAREAYTKLDSNQLSITRKGGHWYFQGKPTTNGKIEGGDLRSTNGVVVAPPSVVVGEDGQPWTYRWHRGPVHASELKPFPEHLIPTMKTKGYQVQPIDEIDTLRRITRARAWLAKVDPPIKGVRWGGKMFYACSWVLRKFNLTVNEAWPLILEFNERAEPKFTEKELIHKLTDAAKKAGTQ